MTALGACTTHGTARAGDDAATLALLENAMPQSRTLSGNYLAGRYAQRIQDWRAAQNYMGEVAARDAQNGAIQQRTFLLAVGAGEYAKAYALGEKILQDNPSSEIAMIFLASESIAQGDYHQALDYLAALPADGFGDYTKPLLMAWAHAGLGEFDVAQEVLAKYAKPDDSTYRLHAGLVEELRGNAQAAADHYKVAMASGLSLHSAILIGHFFERHQQPQVAALIYKGMGQLYTANPFTQQAGLGTAPQTVIPNITRAADGAGYAIFDIATLLYERRAYDSAQIYGNIVQMLMPNSPFSRLMMGDIAAIHYHYDEAIAYYDGIGRGSPLYWLSRMRTAEVYEISGRLEEAVALLGAMAQEAPTRAQALIALGDIYRRQNNFAHAVEAYDAALAGVETLTAEHWPVIYARGMALERLSDWERAEKDLVQALAFQPDNPMILNYLGYSWADKGINMDKALGYLQRAVALSPHDANILDSYGWALYRAGKVADATGWLEKAVERMPSDSTILDHLGDAYWSAGRHAEARFQWQRARDLTDDTAFRTAMDGKIKNGLALDHAGAILHKEAKL